MKGAARPWLAGLGLFALAAAYPAGRSSADVESQTAASESEFDRYLKRAAVLKKHRDQGEMDIQAVLKVLGEEGVLEEPKSGQGIKSFAAGFRPFQVRVYGGLWRWPLRAGIVSSEFKRRWGRRHEGIDIAADPGDPVLAAAPGTVLYSGDGLRGYGNALILRHDQKTTTLYAHNQELLVKKGGQVKAGQIIAKVGSTGKSTGPHLHFEIRKAGKAVNPRKVLVKSRF